MATRSHPGAPRIWPRLWSRSAVFGAGALVLLATGCLSGPRNYLHFSTDYSLPGEYVDPQTYNAVVSRWTRVTPLGLGGGLAATLEAPAVGAAIISRDAERSHATEQPDDTARGTWSVLYGRSSDLLPVRILWRFDKHLYQESTIDPTFGWTFTLSDDLGHRYAPVSIGAASVRPDPLSWLGDFTLWFKRKTVDGRLLFTSHTRELTLTVEGQSGKAAVRWRFLPLLDRVEYGVFDQLDSPGAAGEPSPYPRPSVSPTPQEQSNSSVTAAVATAGHQGPAMRVPATNEPGA